MRKYAVTTIAFMTLVISGCSSIVKDHGLDYQTAKAVDKPLDLPDGHEPVEDRLVIPNEDQVLNLDPTGEFEAPRAPFLYQPIADVPLILNGTTARLELPTDMLRAKSLVTSYLATLATEDMLDVVQSSGDELIISKPIQLEKQGFWRRTWSSITRLYPPTYQFEFSLSESGSGSVITIEGFTQENDAREPIDLDEDAEPTALVLEAWNYMARKVSEDSVLLSNQGKIDLSQSALWVNQKGLYAYYLGKQFDPSEIDSFIRSQPEFYLVEEPHKGLAVVPSDEVARVGDVVEFTVPVKAQSGSKQMKLFNVYRRNLDDVEWTKRSYPYEVVKQKEGYFLVVDTSALELPGLMSYRLLSMLIN